MTEFKAGLRSLAAGSLPHTDSTAACQLALSTLDIPAWPQLPRLSFLENMYAQYSERFPGVVIDNEQIYIDRNRDLDPELELLYIAYLMNDLEHAAISIDYAAGLHCFLEMDQDHPAIVKGQVTGPFTMLTGITDADKKLGYYDPSFRDIVVKGIAMKAAWQVAYLRQAYDVPVLLFIDEPALAGLGSSSFISVSVDDISQDLAEVTGAIHSRGGLAGVHVCANTDWNILLTSDIDILSFDAYSYFDKFITCKSLIHTFLGRGAVIAWGIIPTAEPAHIEKETPDSLVSRWEKQAALLSGGKWDLKALLQQTIITPSCGTGSLLPELARKVLLLTKEVSAELRSRYL